MSLANELRQYAATTHGTALHKRRGLKVPDTEDVALGNDAVSLDTVVLFADLKDSTGLVKGWPDWFAAEIYKNYLYAASRIIRAHEGEITAFDGDRVMGVFIGDSKNSNAAKVALKINWAVRQILQPAIAAQYPGETYVLQQKVGVASSSTLVARGGIRGNNDLLWIGNAANTAAKLSALDLGYSSYITAEVFDRLNDDSKYAGSSRDDMWADLGPVDGHGRIYGSTYWWTFE